MKIETQIELDTAIKKLAEQATKSGIEGALKYSQAALNLAHTLVLLENNKDK